MKDEVQVCKSRVEVLIKGDVNTCAKVTGVGLPINITCLVKRESQKDGSDASLND